MATYARWPKIIPFEMLYDSGIKIMQIKAGTASAKSSKLIFVTEPIIITPTRISTGAVAALGIDRKSGAKISATKKQIAVTNAVSPLRPPTLTPVALSAKVVTVLEPITAPRVVAMASTKKACLRRGILPSGVYIFALLHTPISVPIVSKRSRKSSVQTTKSISVVKILLHCILQKIGSIDGGVLITPCIVVTPKGIPIIVINRMPISSAPLTFFTSRTAVIIVPITANIGVALPRSPRATCVAL